MIFFGTDGIEIEITSDGTKYWRINGCLHRENKPAIEYDDGTKYWYLNGRLHRKDGPAFEDADGNKVWYLNGVYLDYRC